MKSIKIILILSIYLFVTKFALTDTLSHEVKLSLDKSEFTQGEDIILRAEFDINKGDSIEFCTQSNFFLGIIITDEHGKCYRYIDYFLLSFGRIIFPEVNLPPHKMLVMETKLNREFCFDIWKYDSRDTNNIPVGKYRINFEDRFIACWKSVSINSLTFSVLPNK